MPTLSRIVVSALLALAACAHPRPALRSSVAIPAAPIEATNHDAEAAPHAMAVLARAAASLPSRPPACGLPALAGPPRAAGPIRQAALSGGGLHGAFGAGFLLGLQDAGALPAEPDVVTGISTGALQSTFLFLAREPVPRDRDYRWRGGMLTVPSGGEPVLVPGRSSLEDLALAYSITREADILAPAPLGAVGLLTQGAKGSFAPLRRRLLSLVSPETIRAVATEACRGRRLLVGVADVDDGQGYALDLTALALRAYDGEASPALMTLVRAAYVDALLASASVPVGAPPVRLRLRDMQAPVAAQHREHLFVDGGARFGLFLGDPPTDGPAGTTGETMLLVNTGLSIDPWHEGNPRDPTSGWLLTMLGLRTVEILENQVYRLSVQTAEDGAGDLGGLHMAYLSNQNIGGELPDDHEYRGASCAEWHHRDAAQHPIEFYPAYMACLIDYGRARGRAQAWNLIRAR